MSGQTLYDKVWNRHVVREMGDGTALLYIDRHLVHEVTSPQAFEGMELAKRRLWRLDTTIAVPDHNVPTAEREFISNPESRLQVQTLGRNCASFGVNLIPLTDVRQGIVHILGPEQGLTLPGTTVVCGDSHTSTHGAFAALALGIGTSDVEHVFATQSLLAKKSKSLRIEADGELRPGVVAKDVILHIIGTIGTAGGTGHTIEYAGETIRGLTMEGRMTVCNMSVEAGARAGMVAVDEKTVDYVEGRPYAPSGREFQQAADYWMTLCSDDDAEFDRTVHIDAAGIRPQVSWGTSPEMVVEIGGLLPDPDSAPTGSKREGMRRAYDYMGLSPGTPINEVHVDKVFIGSCTNSRIEDLRLAARIADGRRIAPNIMQAMVVPGSGLVQRQAEKEGLDKLFRDAGFEWRSAGCSMCLGMNDDRLSPHERCASTSNRNFEGRQGYKGRTHLVSPPMAAAAAIAGHFVDVSEEFPA